MSNDDEKLEYKRCGNDEIDWIEVGQLHEATLRISQNCFEFKKLCIGLIGISAVLLGKLTSNQLDLSYFVVPFLICLGFWIADFTAYYYQRATRKRMNKCISVIAERNKLVGRRSNDIDVSWYKSMFNGSMSIYFVLSGFAIFGLVLFVTGCIS